MATSYNGWTASKDPKAIGIDAGFRAAGRPFPGGVKSGDVAVVFAALVEEFDRTVEELDLYTAGDEWGYLYKPSANDPSSLSCHASGTALDLNATRHPNGVAGTFTAAQVSAIRALLAKYTCIRWGGDFSGTKDEMHFEIRGNAAAVKAVADKIRNGTIPTNPTEDPMAQDLRGLAWLLMRGHLLRDPVDTVELDNHHWRLAELQNESPSNYIQRRAEELAGSAEGVAVDEYLANEMKFRDQ